MTPKEFIAELTDHDCVILTVTDHEPIYESPQDLGDTYVTQVVTANGTQRFRVKVWLIGDVT